MRKDEEKALEWADVKRDWPLWVFMAGLFIAAFLLYPHLPEQVPRHWNLRGEVDAYYSRRLYGAFCMPVTTLVLYLMLIILPRLDPKKENYSRFAGAYTFIRWMMVLFFGVFYGVTILAALGYNLNMAMVIKIMTALVFIMIGNFMGQFRHNYFVGIKTPWTLADEQVWQKTHRLGAKVWVIGGLFCLASAFVNGGLGMIIFLIAVTVMAGLPVIYSYLIFTKLKG
ncbi:SdpI family protein [Thermosyntropha sp.]|uniref:SdpI family protein n=1 Tax=Thermosyntropha sp. TaxID=2740820 RepID=UPI002600538C|nr:SdpI family protein [Thermosyntropha sp.]MBO8159895.1 SdpI family protein [Thermosyntropha sp.]